MKSLIASCLDFIRIAILSLLNAADLRWWRAAAITHTKTALLQLHCLLQEFPVPGSA